MRLAACIAAALLAPRPGRRRRHVRHRPGAAGGQAMEEKETMSELDRLEKISDAALMRPWRVHPGSYNVIVLSASGLNVATCAWQDRDTDRKSAEIIAAAVNALPALLRVARAAQVAYDDEVFDPRADVPELRAALAALAAPEATPCD